MTFSLRLIGFIGLLTFVPAFVLTFLSPIHYERAARGFLEFTIEEQLRDRLEIVPAGLAEGRLGQLAQALGKRHEEEIARIKEQLTSGLKVLVAAGVQRMQDLDCECRQRLSQVLDIAAAISISTLEGAEPQLRRIIEGRYGEIVTDLMRDLRIFMGTNLVAFVILLGLSFAKPGNVRQLFVPGVLLGLATITASGFYLFGQNWLFTLLYSDYVGAAYAVWLLLIFGFLCDVAFFRARITTSVVDTVVWTFTHALSLLPC